MEKKSAQLCLGTVQLGMEYGIKNSLGRRPVREEAFSILDAALSVGIETFDTASSYGVAEDILGAFHLAEKGGKIVSKLRAGCTSRGEVVGEVETSLERLHARRISAYLLHDAGDMGRIFIMEGLRQAQEDGLIESIGVSVYTPEEALLSARDQRIDCVQVPYNVLDRRLDQCGFFETAKENGKAIYVRSVFLQGLLLMKPEAAEAHVVGAGKYVEKFRRISTDYGYTASEAAFLYAVLHPYVDYVVFGVDTADEVSENAAIMDRAETAKPLCDALQTAFQDVPQEVLVPMLWRSKT